jgi:hypothetical protein
MGLLIVAAMATGCSDAAPSDVPETGTPQPAIASVASAQCSDHQLRVSIGANQHALRAEVTYIRLTNISSRPCWLHGFPRIRLLDHQLRPLPTLTRHYRPAPPPRVTLDADGGHARTILSSFPANRGPAGPANRCPNTGGVRVTAPGLVQAHILRVTRRYCDHGKITLYPVIQQPYGTVAPTASP